ncbi:MAG: hypothetical protein HYX53_04815 [Chloroflexi bacterium]|nr:hypothetical protein [Chloroflexota bacterium]
MGIDMREDLAGWIAAATKPRVPRNEADRVLMEFGYDPWQFEDFLRLTPTQRLRALKSFTGMVAYARRAHARRS